MINFRGSCTGHSDIVCAPELTPLPTIIPQTHNYPFTTTGHSRAQNTTRNIYSGMHAHINTHTYIYTCGCACSCVNISPNSHLDPSICSTTQTHRRHSHINFFHIHSFIQSVSQSTT
ncbi:unnamed protein product [Schistosoma mattheei]|uniref:Uncharacterized protein n=1 Tax=Schistosoma mattheei TaxID=31246 RepID=A0AA85ATI9_9TREM|nr:unnamed protein product [Schistosoma mattheei]